MKANGDEKVEKPCGDDGGTSVGACSDDDDNKLNDPPPILLATEITATSFIANWASVKGAESYKLQVSENISFSVIVNGI